MTAPIEAAKNEPLELVGSLYVARDWIADLANRLGWQEHDTAFYAMVAGLHGLRDSLRRDEAAYLGLALPTLLRGFYFDGWRPLGRVPRADVRAAFLGRIHDGVRGDPAVDPEAVARALLALLSTRLPAAARENAKAASPPELHALWPD